MNINLNLYTLKTNAKELVCPIIMHIFKRNF